jgi:DNA-binding GntR family transcriptional regulator
MAIYRQIADDIRRQIADGVLMPGAQLPTFQELAARYEVSTYTVQRCVRLLTRDGYVRSIRGHGTYVAYNLPSDLVQRIIRALDAREPIADEDAEALKALLQAQAGDLPGDRGEHSS